MSIGAIVLIVCLVLSLGLVIAAIVVPLLAFKRLQKHVARTSTMPVFTRLTRLPEITERLNGDLTEMQALIPRVQAAIQTIMDSLAELRLPQAMAALRVAGAAIRLLLVTLRHAA